MLDTKIDYLTLEQFPHLMTYLETSVCVSFVDEQMRINMRNFFLDQVRAHLSSKTDDEGEIQHHCRIADEIYTRKRLAMLLIAMNSASTFAYLPRSQTKTHVGRS